MRTSAVAAAAFLLVMGAGVATLVTATGSSVTNVPPAELANWEKSLRKAGATSAEIIGFEEMLRGIPARKLPEAQKYLNSSPTIFGTYLMGVRREALEEHREPNPDPLFPDMSPVRSCASLREVSLPDSTVDAATIESRDGSCRVTATVIHPPAHNPITVFIALPTKAWNGRFRGTGGGGYSGGSKDGLSAPVRKGYAVGATDTGNPDGTANFAIDPHGKPAWQRMRDNAYIGIHDMTVVGKALAEAFYGKAPRYSYFWSGSTGGRQALTEAQRYPQDYDGILALSPAIARDRYVPAQLWPQVVMHEANDFLSKEKREAATAAAVKACDSADGVVDGVIDDPTRCQYDPAALVGTKIGDSTFTETDARIVREIWQGPRAHDGSFLWWGPTPDTDLTNVAGSSGSPLMGKPCWEGLDWFRYFLVLDPNWDWKTLTRGEYELLFLQSIQEYASIYGGDDPNLTGFRDRGGRLLIVHGLADQYVPPQKTIDYYNKVKQRMGGPREPETFIRLFLVPGADHGYETPVPTPSFGAAFDSLIQWVEHDRAPEMLVAELDGVDGKPVRTRPLFPYPQVAKYKGSGSTNVAANFASSSPPQ